MIGRQRPRVPDDELHSVHDLRDLSPEVIAKLRALGPYEQHAYLFELTDVSVQSEIPRFLRLLQEGGAGQPQRGVLLIPDLPLEILVRRPLRDLLANMQSQSAGHGLWRQVIPDLEEWRRGQEYVGAPAVEVPDAPQVSGDDGIMQVRLGVLRTRPLDEPLVGARRWLASRIAYRALQAGRPLAEGPEALLEEAGVRWEQATQDARLACAFLVDGEHQGSESAVPGLHPQGDGSV